MRRLAAAAALTLLTAFGAGLPLASHVAAATPISNAKVVIIVGATEGSTSTYRSYADQAYAEAIKYTPNVTKIYSPNATWTKVKAAAAGANLLLYYGHGNGWPSPYTYDPAYTTKDGFGLNDPANLSDNVHKYYGEPSVATLGLAPNAVVLLGNLCYASGNSEPGGAAPTVSVAHQRIDNYAAGFIKGGARAVIADGHGGLVSYIQGLFTTSQTIRDLWRSVPNFHDHEVSFASTRSSGYTAFSDPDTTSGGYYRSLVTTGSITTTTVTQRVGDTGVDPATLVVPGRAEANTAGTAVYSTAAATRTGTPAPTLDLPAGTRLKTLATAAVATATSPAVIQVAGLDDPSITGYVAADRLKPRDSRAPVVLGIDTGSGRFSPNADGRSDTQTIAATLSETAAWTVEVRNSGGTVVRTQTGSGAAVSVTWDGLSGGHALPDGTYGWTIRATDAWKNGPTTASGQVVIDTVGPVAPVLSPDGSVVSQFSPNGDGVVETIATTATTAESGSLVVRVANAAKTTVRSFTSTAASGANTVTWDGRSDAGTVVPDGEYSLTVAVRDAAGNLGPGRSRTVRVVTLLGFVATSATPIYPQDLDRFAPSATLSFRLSRAATVTWTLRDAAGAIVITHVDNAARAAGTQSWAFDGRKPDGTMLPAGAYTSYVYATDGTYAYAQAVKVDLNAFAVVSSTATPKRGSKVTITATTAEPLSGHVELYVTQPGLSTSILTMSALSSTSFRLTFTPKTTGSAGTMTLKVWAKDADGRSQATIVRLPLS